MEYHACKLCDRSFANSRALGGHMKSHFAVLRLDDGDEVEGYGLRENPKKSVRMVEDWESEGEEAGDRKRSRRSEEDVSSISDASSDEDAARCLMMLSQDVWSSSLGEEEEEEYKSAAPSSGRGGRYKYQCETCSRGFRSYQALGGHRAGHKKNRARQHTIAVNPITSPARQPEEKIHQCPVCCRVFPSGQALGGHKRSHLSGAAVAAVVAANVHTAAKPGETLIDLNLPASMEEAEDSPVELSVISDEDFANSYI